MSRKPSPAGTLPLARTFSLAVCGSAFWSLTCLWTSQGVASLTTKDFAREVNLNGALPPFEYAGSGRGSTSQRTVTFRGDVSESACIATSM